MTEVALAQLRTIPGVGKSIAKDLYDLGIRRVSDLKNKNPDDLKDYMEVETVVEVEKVMTNLKLQNPEIDFVIKRPSK